VIIESIPATLGFPLPEPGYLRRVGEIARDAGALLILDEVQTGVGRTGRLWAYEHAGVEPDVMTLAKALANGVPIGAMLCRADVASVLTPGTHASTFGGTPFVTSVALATLTTVISERIPEHAARMGRELMEGLRALAADGTGIRQVRGKGLLIGIDLDRAAGPVVEACREAGLLVLTAGDRVLRLTPPLVVQPDDCRRALDVLRAALRATAR
jgi:acetylornithine/succinyldiaminopimelate/putrescine aminotransferase